MPETIYTIPINEAFDRHEGCPLCSLSRMLEKNEIDLILGPSMMEPDVRVSTNKLGFCATHYKKLLVNQKKLPLALMLETHLMELSKRLDTSPEKQVRVIAEKENGCYICRRVDSYIDAMYGNLFWLYDREEGFRAKFREQSCFCLPHCRQLLERGKNKLGKKLYLEFSQSIKDINKKYLEKLLEDIRWFAKKFDYRFADEPWYDSRDSIERTIRFITGESVPE